VSFDIFLQAFRAGDATVGDGEAALELLEPLIVQRENGWARIATADGEADVYGIDDAATGLVFNHVSGVVAYALLFDIARRAGFVVMPVGCPTCVLDYAMQDDLPPEVAVDVVVVGSGDDLRRAIEQT
jgi:hypothetical protein